MYSHQSSVQEPLTSSRDLYSRPKVYNMTDRQLKTSRQNPLFSTSKEEADMFGKGLKKYAQKTDYSIFSQ